MTYKENPKWFWLRWIAVLPVSIIGYLVVSFVLYAFNWLSPNSRFGENLSNSWIVLYIMPLATMAIASYCFVWVGKEIAPKYKKYVALGLMIINIIYNSGILLLAIKYDSTFDILNGAVHIIAAIFAYVSTDNET